MLAIGPQRTQSDDLQCAAQRDFDISISTPYE